MSWLAYHKVSGFLNFLYVKGTGVELLFLSDSRPSEMVSPEVSVKLWGFSHVKSSEMLFVSLKVVNLYS